MRFKLELDFEIGEENLSSKMQDIIKRGYTSSTGGTPIPLIHLLPKELRNCLVNVTDVQLQTLKNNNTTLMDYSEIHFKVNSNKVLFTEEELIKTDKVQEAIALAKTITKQPPITGNTFQTFFVAVVCFNMRDCKDWNYDIMERAKEEMHRQGIFAHKIEIVPIMNDSQANGRYFDYCLVTDWAKDKNRNFGRILDVLHQRWQHKPQNPNRRPEPFNPFFY